METTTTIRGDGLGSASTKDPSFRGVIDLPYKLTTGHAAGTFLAELANRRIVGSRASAAGPVLVPAQDFCATSGERASELVVVGNAGTLSGFTETAAGVLGLIRLDGADTDMVHRVDAPLDSLTVGDRVAARWADEAQGAMLDLECFVPAADAPETGDPQPLQTETEPIPELKYGMRLEYDHAYGPYYGPLFDELATSRRILGSRCPSCRSVLVPPREYCEVCFVRTAEMVDVPDTGILKAFSVIHLEFVGQTREPPYVYAEIVLEGANTRLIHCLGGIDAEKAPKQLRCGMRVKAVWKEGIDPTGTLEDIEHFEVIDDLIED